MSDNSLIQWTDASWNFVHGCTRVSEGCVNCYIDKQPPFRQQRNFFDSKAIGGSTRIILMPHKLELPTTWRKPRRVFVNSLSDLFHKQVPVDLVARAFAVMLRTPQHSYQILTKRHGRMRALLSSPRFQAAVRSAYVAQTGTSLAMFDAEHGDGWWPLRNVWLGVSTEDQPHATLRIEALLSTPAHVRWISAEPLLSAVRLADRWLGDNPRLDWVVVGGESGVGSAPRAMDLDWARSLVSQCRDAGVPVYVKQLGTPWARVHRSVDPKGGEPSEWPLDLRVRQYPRVVEGELVSSAAGSLGVPA